MYDFLTVKKEFVAKQQRYVYSPSFLVKPKIKDLMIRSRDFYAIVNLDTGFWIKDESEAIELIDKQVEEYVAKDVGPQLMSDQEHGPIIKRIMDSDNHLIDKWHKYCQKDLRDRYEPLNQKVLFTNSEVKRSDYVTYTLPYPIEENATPYYDKLVNTLYLPEEKEKFEYMVGCILAGDQSKIQKIFVFYGLPGSGKSTIINKVIVNTILGGTRSPYCTKFTAELLANRDAFGTGFLSQDPVLAFDDDADLSRIESNTTLNLIISHEAVRVNDKFARTFTAYPNCILVCGTNEPVQLSPNSGMNRRLIDIRQTGEKLDPDDYDDCIDHIAFEAPGIAFKCLQVYKSLGKNHYNRYQPEEMLSMTSPFHNFVKDHYFELKDGITLSNAYKIYQEYCEECNFKTVMTRYKFRDSLKLYFEDYDDTFDENGTEIKRFFSGFKQERIGLKPAVDKEKEEKKRCWLEFNCTDSLFDRSYKDQPAQYAKEDGSPKKKWEDVKTVLGDVDSTKVHYVKVPKDLIVIDFDIKDEDGNKSFEKNLQAALKFPPTYAELSKSGTGIHLHYIYTGGNPEELSRIYADNVEIKVFVGNAALRRMVTKCNDIPIAKISSGLPMKGGQKVIDWEGYKNEKILRAMIIKNLNKEYHPATKPSIDYINHLLNEAYRSGAEYDVRDMEQAVLGFALKSTHKADYCVDVVAHMHFCSDNYKELNSVNEEYNESPIVIFDIESYPGDENNEALFLLCWKYYGSKEKPVRMYNPKPSDVEKLFRYRLVGFNNRGYDNHMLYAASQGYTPSELNKLSQRLIDGDRNAKFREAYNISYTDIYDFASAANKKGLKKWEIELGIHHKEMSIPWDKPCPKNRWDEVGDYCCNDVIATEAVFDHLQPDFIAREILADLSGLTVNDTTNQHTIQILTHGIDNPQQYYIYTDLSKIFNGYEFNEYKFDPSKYKEGVKIVSGKSYYKGIDPGEGGRKIGYPGYYQNVGLFDVASMHPSSMIKLNVFGDEITGRLKGLKDARVAIKHGDYEKAIDILGEKVRKYLTGTQDELKKMSKALADALKTAINSVYGLTSASFDNKLRDPRNKDNIVAKYGALFMVNLEEEIRNRGYTVVHVSTDSIKVANVDDEIASFIFDYGKRYGFDFEYEAFYSKMCLINDAVYIAKVEKEDGEDVEPYWAATGKQFAVPYVKKTLFSHEEITFKDMCETFQTREGAIYMDYNENLPDPTDLEKQLKKLKKDELAVSSGQVDLVEAEIAKCHDYRFVGNIGQFTPILPGNGAAELYRIKDGKAYALPGSTGFKWFESEEVRNLGKEDLIDRGFYRKLVDDAKDVISEFVDFEAFVAD